MLKKLYQLQQLEAAAAALNAERINSDEYRQLRSIRASFEAEKQKLAQANAAIAKLEKQIESLEKRKSELEVRIAGEKQAMYDGSVTNSRELEARQGQLESLQSKAEAAQKEKSEQQPLLVKKQEEAGKLRHTLTDKQIEFSRIRDIYQVKQEERDGRGRRLEEEKAALIAEIDADSLAWFETQRERFAGAPVAFLNSQRICSGCHTMVPQSTYKRASSGISTLCENCGRTLFVED